MTLSDTTWAAGDRVRVISFRGDTESPLAGLTGTVHSIDTASGRVQTVEVDLDADPSLTTNEKMRYGWFTPEDLEALA